MVAPHVLRVGANVVEDLSSGKKLRDSAIKRIPEALRQVIVPDKPVATAALSGAANLIENSLSRKEQTGSGKRKRRKDIFD
jgi:hypothetical protein